MSGNFGYIKTKKLESKEYKRTAMNDEDFTTNRPDASNAIKVSSTIIKLENMENYASRKETIQKIISDIISKEKFTVAIDLKDVNVEEECLKRFVIELLPRLREIGGSITITNNNILSNDFLLEYKIYVQ